MTIQTPWELNGSPAYSYTTTPADEAVFMSALVATGKVALTQVGIAPNGIPLNLIRLGVTTPPTFTAHPRSGFWVSSQHTRETSPREAMFRFIRDAVESTDPALITYLTDHPMFILATPHPESMGQEADPDVIDFNRDHLRMTHPATWAIASVMQTVKPQLVVDMHTGGWQDVDVASVDFAGVDVGIRDLSATAAVSVRTYLTANSVSTGSLGPLNQTMPLTLRNVSGMRGAVALLTEDYGGNLMGRRIEVEQHAIRGVINWHGPNSDRIESTRNVAKMRATGEGLEATVPAFLGSAHSRYETDGAVDVSPPPASYLLSPAQWSVAEPYLAAFGVSSVALPYGGRSVPLAQPERPVIPLLLDADSTQGCVQALSVGRPPAGAVSFGFVRAFNRDCPVTGAAIGVNGEALEAPVL